MSSSVKLWRIRTRKKLIELKGGKCQRCGWSGHISAYDFHHIDPTTKDSTISSMMASPKKLEILLNEIDKCELLCAICHRIQHGTDYDENIHALKAYPKKPVCKKCSTVIGFRNNSGFCRLHNTKIVWPDTKSLIDLVNEIGFSAAGRQLGVSDNGIRKRIKSHS